MTQMPCTEYPVQLLWYALCSGHTDNKDRDSRQQFPRTVKYHNAKYIETESPKLTDFETAH
jgi:hypothetical protein